jgi:hypothetical protein
MPIPYNAELCKFLQLPGEVSQTYSGITTHVYPLQANPTKLKDFLDEFLVHNPFIEFQPVAPIIVMQVCDYPKVDTSSAGFDHRLFAFREVAFGIPIAVFEIDDVARRFSEYGMVYPFIFVDNPLSMAAGRQIYGWSKAGIKFQLLTPEFGPNQPRPLLKIRIDPFKLAPLLSSDGNDDSLTALAVNQTRPFLSGFAGVAQTLTIVPQAVSGFFTGTATLLDAIGNLMGGYGSPTPVSLISDQMRLASGAVMNQLMVYLKALNLDVDKLKSMMPALATALPGFPGTTAPANGYEVSIYTIKQVSDASAQAAETGCYQAVVRSRMGVSAQDGGLLFDPLAADPSGGIEISLARDKDHKDLEDLITLLAAPTLRESNGRQLYTFRPVLPFWGKLDLTYGLADRQWWRSKYSSWQQEPPTSIPRRPRSGYEFVQPIAYIRKGSGATLQVGGRRDARNAVIHIFPIPANRENLQNLVNRYLNGDRFYFEVKPAQFVYVTLLTYDDMQSPGAGQSLSDRVLSFNILVDYYARRDLYGVVGPASPAFIPLYTFVGTDWNYITEYEVYGRLTFRADLVSPEDVWINEPRPGLSEVLTVRTTLFPELQGKAKDVDLITIFSKHSSSQPIPAQPDLGNYGLSEFLTLGNIPSLSIALKQVRNAIKPDSADYQSIVGIRRTFHIVEPIIRFPARIEITKNDSFPLVEVMGLRGNSRRFKSGVELDSFDIRDGYSVRTSLHEEPGTELWRRVAQDGRWVRTD